MTEPQARADREPDNEPRSSHWARLPEAGMSFGLWLLFWIHKIFGRGLYRALIWPVSWYFVAFRASTRHASIEYQQRLGILAPDARRWLAWRAGAHHVQVFADALIDKLLVWTGGLDLSGARMHMDPRFRAAIEAGKGGVIMVAHFGNLEVLRALGEHDYGVRLHILVHTKHAERFNRMLWRMNPDSAERLLQVTELDTATVVHLSQRVDAGDFVVIAADRVPTSGDRTVDVSFLGAPAPLPIGPWVLAAALGCPVYWLTCFKAAEAPDQYSVFCEQMHERVLLPRASRMAALTSYAQDFAERLEQVCRQAPYAWFNFFPFWRARSQGK